MISTKCKITKKLRIIKVHIIKNNHTSKSFLKSVIFKCQKDKKVLLLQ